MRKSFLAVLLALTVSCERPSPVPASYEVWLVGEGAEAQETQGGRALNRAQGRAMYRGFKAAYDGTEIWKELGSQISLIPRNDNGDPDRASQIAEELYTRPEVLAVVGHASSGTTIAGQEFYSRAGIPLIMPIATSPMVCAGDRNCFRLPQPDDTGQAPAISHVLRTYVGAKNVYIVWDNQRDARGYSEPLLRAVTPLLADLALVHNEINQASSVDDIAKSIKDQAADTVVFLGYGTTVKDLIGALRRTYPDAEPSAEPGKLPATRSDRPTLVLSDGCKIGDLDISGFKTYLTFPAPDSRGIRIPQLQTVFKSDTGASDPSYEVFGFDGAIILGEAIKICKARGKLSRRCIIETLSSPRNVFKGALEYRFERGNNGLTPYYVYSNVGFDRKALEPTGDLQYDSEISAQTLRSYGIR